MASYITKAGSAAMKAVEVVRTKAIPPAVEYYKATMAKNAEYVVKDPAAVDKLGRQLVFSNLARLPTMLEAAQGEIKVLESKWKGRMDLPMTEIGVGALFTAEVYAWFCVGEVLGRGGSITGY